MNVKELYQKALLLFQNPILRNKYVFTSLIFVFWMLFFDEHNFISQVKLKLEVNQLQKDQEYYQQEILKVRSDLEELKTDDRHLEKFAREKYKMKKPDEEVFVLVRE